MNIYLCVIILGKMKTMVNVNSIIIIVRVTLVLPVVSSGDKSFFQASRSRGIIWEVGSGILNLT